LDKQAALLNPLHDKDVVELQKIEDKKTQLIRQATNEQTKIRQQAEEKQSQDINKAETQMATTMAMTAEKALMSGKNMAQAMAKAGISMAESAMKNLMEMKTIDGQIKLEDAKTAFANAYKWASPAGPIAGAAAGAIAFASVMAFENGGLVPGEGFGDTVPAMLSPGETVVSKALTDHVKNSENGSGGKSGHTINYSPTIHAVDGDGVARMLQKHEAVFTAHLTSVLRKHHMKG
jgi:hypothetical protein